MWSPRGHWLAYHSHRSKTPVPWYDAPGSTDDIWLREVGAPAQDTAEIRLTDFGLEAGAPDWSRDGTRLLFVSFDRAHPDDPSAPYVLTVDTVTGRAVRHERLRLPRQIANTLSAAWSPVSDDIALEADLGGDRHAVWLVPAGGGRPREVIEYSMPTIGGVSWTEDGKALVYAAVAGEHMQLFRIGVAGGVPTQLTHDPANLLLPCVSPDGRRECLTGRMCGGCPCPTSRTLIQAQRRACHLDVTRLD